MVGMKQIPPKKSSWKQAHFHLPHSPLQKFD